MERLKRRLLNNTGRRLNLPASWCRYHDLVDGSAITAASHPDTGTIILWAGRALAEWRRLREELLAMHPGVEPPLLALLDSTTELSVSDGDRVMRVVFPASFPLRLTLRDPAAPSRLLPSTPLSERTVCGALVLRPIDPVEATTLAVGETGPGLASVAGLFDPEAIAAEATQHIATADILFFDRTFARKQTRPGEELQLSIRTSGMSRPVLLRPGPRGYQIIDGFDRVAVARQQQHPTVPALVLDMTDAQARMVRLALSDDRQPPLGARRTRVETSRVVIDLLRRGATPTEVTTATSTPRRTVARLARIAEHPTLAERVYAGQMTVLRADTYARLGIVDYLDRIEEERWSLRRMAEEAPALRRAARDRRRAAELQGGAA